VFLVNRDERSPASVEIDVRMLGKVAIQSAQTLSDDDPHATNSLQHQDRVVLAANPTATLRAGTVTIVLPPVSWTALTLTRSEPTN
jgi:alpha-N-arabinofuranosidase